MLRELLENKVFSKMMQLHINECLEFLINNDVKFSILANLKKVEFNPELPSSITANFEPMIFFTLAGYTFESAKLSEDTLVFEAGFGKENIGSVVSVPLGGILQIIVEETPILINMSIPADKEQTGIKKSMNALLSNPENQVFLKND